VLVIQQGKSWSRAHSELIAQQEFTLTFMLSIRCSCSGELTTGQIDDDGNLSRLSADAGIETIKCPPASQHWEGIVESRYVWGASTCPLINKRM